MASKSGISTGALLRYLLISSEYIKNTVSDIFPCVAFEETLLPYIQYYAQGISPREVKTGSGIDKMLYDVVIYSAEYDQAIELAEAVREATAGMRVAESGLYISNIRVTNFATRWAGDSYEVTLRLELTTNSLNSNIITNA